MKTAEQILEKYTKYEGCIAIRTEENIILAMLEFASQKPEQQTIHCTKCGYHYDSLLKECPTCKPEQVGVFPSDNDIKEMMTKDHSRWKDGKYRRTYWDRVTGGKIVRDFIKQSQPEQVGDVYEEWKEHSHSSTDTQPPKDQEPEPTALANSQYREERERKEMEEQDQEPEITEEEINSLWNEHTSPLNFGNNILWVMTYESFKAIIKKLKG